jgi:uncharacterized protein YqhQ
MNEKVLEQSHLNSKGFLLVYLVIGIFLVFSVVSMNFIITISVVSALLLVCFMSSNNFQG